MQIRQLLQAFQWVDSCGKTSRSEFKHENLRRLHWKLTTFSCHEKLAKVVLRHTQTPLLDLFLLSHFWEPLYSPRNYLKVASVTTLLRRAISSLSQIWLSLLHLSDFSPMCVCKFLSFSFLSFLLLLPMRHIKQVIWIRKVSALPPFLPPPAAPTLSEL